MSRQTSTVDRQSEANMRGHAPDGAGTEVLEADAALRENANVLLCVTGSVAAIRAPDLLHHLTAHSCIGSVRIVATESARHFMNAEKSLPTDALIYYDADEYKTWKRLGDPVLHIELRNWADVLLVAPLSANSLAKISLGLCDNLVTSIARAWPLARKPFLVAPAMNTAMWEHPLTAAHLESLRRPEMSVALIPPISKTLACGDVGMGAMASAATIAAAVAEELRRHRHAL
jgi:phosphopantothenoylcysteine decarboxylase